MSNHYIANINNQNKEENKPKDMQYFLAKKLKININKVKSNNRPKLVSIQKTSNRKFHFKIKLNYPLANLNPNFCNKKSKNKINNIIKTPRNNNNFYIENYKDKISTPLSSKKNIYNSKKLLNDILYINNSINDNAKIILPSIKFINKKESIIQTKERSAVFRKKLKEISLGDLFKDKNIDSIIPQKKLKLKKKTSIIKSEWNLFNEKLKDKNNDYLNLEDLTFNKKNNRKLSDINSELNNEYKLSEERTKKGAERLKDFHRQKISDYNKLIKKLEKESEEKKKVLNKYLLLMREDLENSIEFDNKFI